MKGTSFGLDIGTTAVKAVWVSHEADSTTLLHADSMLTVAPGMQSDSPFDQEAMAQSIDTFIRKSKIEVKDVNIALPENHVYTKVIDMPVLTDKELANAIYWEAEQYIPAPLETMSLAWSVLYKPEDTFSQRRMRVLLVAAPLLLIKRYQTILEMAGLKVVSIETEILSVIRGLIDHNYLPTSMIMNIGGINSSLAIVQNGKLMFNHFIPIGGVAMTRVIAGDFGFSQSQAEEYKRLYGLSSVQFEGKIGTAIGPILSELLAEVKKAIALYDERYKNASPLSQVLLTGGSAKLPGIDLYFAKNTGLESIIANPWKMRNVHGVVSSMEALGTDFTGAVGLALKEYD
jgi:type IV pilus assembly protein PilM